jgi:4-hydroxybenzoate polyprenyltransferase
LLRPALGLVRLSHAFPSLLNALATAGIAILAGGDPPTALRLGASMLGMQVSIGAVNDLADVELDRVGKPAKPIPSGMVAAGVARGWAVATGVFGLLLAAPSGLGTIVVWSAALGLGYLYDLRLSRTALSWLPLALALPLVPIFAWLGATGRVPGALLPLVPAAVLAGAALILANGLVDVERDERAGKKTVPVRLGRPQAWAIHAALVGVAVAMAFASAPGPAALAVAGHSLWIVEAARSTGLPLGALMVATGAGLLLSSRPAIRERGWELETVGTLVLGVAWLAGIAA